MFTRQRTGSVVCPACGSLVGVNDEACYSCGRRNPSLWGFSPLIRSLGQDLGFVYVIMVGTIGLYLATVAGSGGDVQSSMVAPLAPSTRIQFLYGASGAYPVFGFGRWWTIFSAGWLHGGLLHIFFNLLWVRQLAPETADLYGPGRTVIVYTISSACGFAISSVMGVLIPGIPVIGGASYITVGASAAIMGLLGAQVCYGRRTGSHIVRAGAWQYAVMLFFFGLIMPGVDNWAHAGGFGGGYLTALALDPRKPERVDHLLGALACLAITAASIVASVVLGLPLLRQ
jgi:rhomboid protease GluP